MRYGIAIDLHATSAAADEVAWRRVLEQARAAEQLGFDLLVVPDHLEYRAGGQGDYAIDDAAVGARESVAILAGLAASTTRIAIGHSVVNAPYRTPAMLAHIAATLADISDGRYSLGIGVGNSHDYDQIGVDADARVARFEEAVEIVSGLLRGGTVDLLGRFWRAARAQLTLAPDDEHRPPVVVAAGGPRTMGVAARFGDAWNGWCPTDPTSSAAADLLDLLDRRCDEADRDPSSIARTFDLGVDPLNLHGARSRSIEMLGRLKALGADEVRCYAASPGSHIARQEAIFALSEMTTEV